MLTWIKWTALMMFVGFFLQANTAFSETGELKLVLKSTKSVSKPIDSKDDRINCDFPEPTDVRDVARAFSLWTNKKYEVDDEINKKVRLISPELVSVSEGEKRFKRMLKRYDLEIVQEGDVSRIVAKE